MSEPRPLRVLLVEDSENDAMLLLRELKRGGYEPSCQRVDTPEAMEAALRDADDRGEPWEIIVSDYYMPRFRGTDALSIVRRLGYDTPFIVVSGKVGEDLAVEIMKAGAQDYITKENMVRLNPAIERELREARVRQERLQTQEALDRSEERFRRLVEQAADAMFVHDLEGRFMDVNRQACESLGYTREELLEMSVPDVEMSYEPGALEKLWQEVSSGTQRTLEGMHRRKDGTTFPVEVRLGMFESEGTPLMLATARDITGRRKAEDVLRENEERFRATFEQAAVGILQVGLEGGWIRVNDRFCEIIGYTREELREISVFDLISPEDFETDYERGTRMLAGEPRDYTEEKRIVGKGGRRIWINLTVSLVHDASDNPRYFIAIVEDIGQRRQAEEGLRLRDRAIAASSNGIVISDPNQPDDPIIYVNASFERITGYTSQEVLGRNCRFLQDEDRDQPTLDEVRAAISEGRECTVVLRNYKKDGTLFWNELRVSPVRDEQGRLIHFIGVQNDVSDRVRAEEALRESEKRFRALVQNASDIIIVLDPDGTIRYESPALERILGYRPEERVGKRVSELIHPDDLEHVSRALADYLEDPGAHTIVEYRVRARDGTWHYFEGIGNNLVDDPSVRGLVVNARDVTDRKRAEREIRESEERYRTLFETMTQGIIYQDAEGRITTANPAAERILGLSLEQMQGKTSQDPRWRTIREDGSELPGEEHPTMVALRTGEKVENEVIGVYVPERDEHRWIKVNAVPQFRPGEDRPYQAYAIFDDVTARKQAEDELQRSENSLAEAQRIAHIGNWHYDVARDKAYWSDELYRIFGLAPKEFVPNYRTFLDFVYSEDRRTVREAVRRAWLGVDYSNVEYRIVRPDGELRTLSTHYECVRDASGRPERLVGTIQDVTEREQAEQALREGEKRYRAVVEQATEGILLVDVDSKRVLEANAAYHNLLGYASEEILELTLYDLVPYSRYDMDCYVRRVMEESSYVSGERRHRRKDGSLVDVEVSANIISYGGREVVCILVRDITERKQNEAKLRQQAELINLSHDAIVVRDTDGIISYWNQGAEEVYGWGKEEAVGGLMHELLKTEFPFSREDVEATLQFGGRWEGELRHTRRDGEIIEVESRQVVVGEAESRIVLEINRDVTERKRNEAELVRLASFPQLNPAPIIETDVAGNTTYLNPAADAWFQELADRGGDHPLLADLERVEAEIRSSGGRPLNREVRVGENFYLQTISRLPESGLLRIYATDVTERRRAEDGLRFLARASEVLSSSLDYHETLSSVARLAVPDLADWCAIDVFENGSLNRLAVVHEDPEKLALARQLRERYPPDPESQYGVSRALRDGRSVLVSEMTESLLEEAARDEEHLAVLRGLGLKSYMAVPLVVRDRTLGVITLASDESGPVYGEADLELAEDLARRAAVAVDNARLYDDAQKEISEREEVETALRKSRERYRTFIAQSTEGILRFELEEPVPIELPEEEQVERFYRHAYLAECNDTLARMYGFSSAKGIIGARLDDIMPRSIPENVEFFKAGVRNGYKLVEDETRKLDHRGNLRYFSNSLTGIVEDGKLVRGWGTQKDITEQRQAEEALRQNEELYRTVVEQAAENIFLVDVETRRILEANDAFCSSLGYEDEEIERLTLYDVIAHDRESVDQNIQRILKEKRHSVGERKYRRRDGSLVDVDVNVSLVSLGDREAMCVVAHDITERKRVEEALRRSEELYRTVVEQAGEGIFLFDAGTKRVLETNTAFQQMLGYSPEELGRMSIYDLISKDSESVDYNVRRALEEGRWLVGERTYRRKDGTTVDVEVSGSVISYRGREVLCAVARDITERKRAEEALREVREAERNRIARDLHDDILQDIVYALQEASILQAISESGGAPELEEIADALRRSVEGLREVIYELRLEETLKQSFEVSLRSLVELNRRMSRKRYILDLELEEGFLENITNSAGREIIRVLQEALNNARRHANPRHVWVRLGVEADDIWAEVEDDGRGFDSETFMGGVGQHSMRHRVTKLGGKLRVESEPGAGTRVSLRVPYYRLVEG